MQFSNIADSNETRLRNMVLKMCQNIIDLVEGDIAWIIWVGLQMDVIICKRILVNY